MNNKSKINKLQRAYAKEMKARLPHWKFLNKSDERIRRLYYALVKLGAMVLLLTSCVDKRPDMITEVKLGENISDFQNNRELVEANNQFIKYRIDYWHCDGNNCYLIDAFVTTDRNGAITSIWRNQNRQD